MWLCKRKNIIKKIDKCLKFQNNGYFDARLKERNKKKDSPCSLTFISKFKREMLLRSIVELGLATINVHLIPYTYTS
jgi:hypothetical protein